MKSNLLAIMISKYKNTLYFISFFALVFSFIIFFNLPCFFKAITSIPCPACGFTRAIISLLKGDFKVSLICSPMAMPVVLAIGFWLLLQNKKSEIILIVILFCNFVFYFYRLINHMIP